MVDVNKPVENPGLVKVMEAYKSSPSQETEAALLKPPTDANFLVALNDPLQLDDVQENGWGVLREGQKIRIPTMVNAQGDFYYFGFTDWEELVKWSQKPPAETPTLIIPFSQLAPMVLESKFNCAGLLINPASHHLLISKPLVASLSGASAPIVKEHVVNEPTRVMLGTPKTTPTGMVEAIAATAKPLRQVKKLYLLLMRKEDGEQSYLLIVEGKGDIRETFGVLAKAASPFLAQGIFLDLVSANERFGGNATKGQKPFYKRGLF